MQTFVFSGVMNEGMIKLNSNEHLFPYEILSATVNTR